MSLIFFINCRRNVNVKFNFLHKLYDKLNNMEIVLKKKIKLFIVKNL